MPPGTLQEMVQGWFDTVGDGSCRKCLGSIDQINAILDWLPQRMVLKDSFGRWSSNFDPHGKFQ